MGQGFSYNEGPKVSPRSLREWATQFEEDARALELTQQAAEKHAIGAWEMEDYEEGEAQFCKVRFENLEDLISLLKQLKELRCGDDYYFTQSSMYCTIPMTQEQHDQLEAVGFTEYSWADPKEEG